MKMAALYVARLALAAGVAAYALEADEVEASVAAMLLSPLGEPVVAASRAVARADPAAFARAVATAALSAVALVGAGFAARARAPPGARVTHEMRKRTAAFRAAPLFAFAAAIGAVAAAVAAASASAATTAVGLAIAVSVTVPLVNAGFAAADARPPSAGGDARRAVERAAAARGARESFARGAVSLAGLFVGNSAAQIALRWHGT